MDKMSNSRHVLSLLWTIDELKRDIAKLTSERDTIHQEYQLVMSERDIVHSEIERLNDAVNELTARLRSSSEEMNRLKREVATCQTEKDRYKQELQELKDRYGADLAMSYLLGDDRSQSLSSDVSLFHVPGMRTSISRAMNNNFQQGISKGSSGDLLRHQYSHTSSSNSSVVGVGLQKNQLSGHGQPSYTFDNLDMANYEIDQLRRHNAQLQDKVVEAQQEAEVSKKRRDWAVSEKKKMILERESIRYLCDSLRKERNTRDRELSKALTDNDELKRQVKELSRQLTELKDKLDESNRLEKENVNNCSRDSAIDTDDNLNVVVGSTAGNGRVRSSENIIGQQGGSGADPDAAAARVVTHPGLTSSESELLELSMKHQSISDATERTHHHRAESSLTDPRFTTLDPIVGNADLDHRPYYHLRLDERKHYDQRIPRFLSMASEPASRPPSVAGDPFDPWPGQLPESYVAAHSGHLTPGHAHGSASGHHTPAGILMPNIRSSSVRNSNQYLDVKPTLRETRDIIVAKSSEPLGISIWVDEKNTGSIFVSSVNENSLAAQAGLQVGDQLLDVNGINLRSGVSMSSASTVLDRSTRLGDELKMRVQYNLHRFNELSRNKIEQDVLHPLNTSLVSSTNTTTTTAPTVTDTVIGHHDF